MSYKISWYIENRVVIIRMYGDITTDEMSSSFNEFSEFLKVGTEHIYLLVDLREVTKFPLNFRDMFQEMGKFRFHERIAWTITLTSNVLISFFGAMASKVIHMPTRTFKTLEEADAFIVHNAPELAPMLATQKAT